MGADQIPAQRERQLCPICERRITPPHFKRHLWKHDREGVDRATVDAAWLSFVKDAADALAGEGS